MNRGQNINIDPEGLHLHTEGHREQLKGLEEDVMQSAVHLDRCGKLLEGTSWKAIAVIEAKNNNRYAPELTVRRKNRDK